MILTTHYYIGVTTSPMKKLIMDIKKYDIMYIIFKTMVKIKNKQGAENMDVKEMISFPSFDGFEIIAGEKGIHREVNTVSVMDAPDIYNWLKGGEFLITTAYIMRDDPMQIKDLIIKINKSGASALGIKLHRFIGELPREVIDIANELDFPLISIPIEFSFVDVINPVLSQVVNKQARKLLYSHKIHKSFTELAISGEGLGKIIETLSNIINKKVIYIDSFFDNRYSSELDHRSIEELKTTFKPYDIVIENKTYGYIIILEEDSTLGEYDRIAMEHASTVLKLEIQKLISNKQIETGYRDEFIQDLIMNNIKSLEEILNRSKLYDWNFDDGNLVTIFDIDNLKSQYLNIKDKKHSRSLENTRENILAFIRKKVKTYFSNAVYTKFSDSIVFIIRPTCKELEKFKDSLEKFCNKIRKEIFKKFNFTITVGIGSYQESPQDIHISYSEAKKSIKFGRSIYSNDSTVFYENLGVYRLFEDLSNTEAMKEFCSSYLGKLIEYDKENNTEFLTSLEYLVKNDWNLKATAKEIFIHYNTMKYRFNKIAEILDVNLKESENKLSIAVALKLLQMV